MCIPRVRNIIHKDFVLTKLKKINAGKIKTIIEKPLKNEKDYKRLLIKMRLDPRHKNGAYIQERFSRGENIKIVYNNEEYWRIVSSY